VSVEDLADKLKVCWLATGWLLVGYWLALASHPDSDLWINKRRAVASAGNTRRCVPAGLTYRWRGGEVERWRGGEVERWRGGGVERWRGGGVARWRGGEVAGTAAQVTIR